MSVEAARRDAAPTERRGRATPWRGARPRPGAKPSRRSKPVALLVAAWLLASAPFAASVGAAELDRATWADLLARHTVAVEDTAGTRVDYGALRGDPAWRAFVDSLDEARPPRSTAGRMAFWIDVYNVLAIDMVVRHWPIDSIKDAGSFFRPVWGREAGRVGGRVVTLHEIEHEVLRPMGDPRIHMAIVCASTSCPSLAREPYDPARLDELLDASVRRFLADPRKGMAIDRAEGVVTLSRIFDWFDEDFDGADGIRGFLAAHAADVPSIPEADRSWLGASRSKIRLRYFDYDWRVNATGR